jgi:hypothetical protein
MGAADVRCRQLDGRAAILMVVARPGGRKLRDPTPSLAPILSAIRIAEHLATPLITQLSDGLSQLAALLLGALKAHDAVAAHGRGVGPDNHDHSVHVHLRS